MAEVFDSLYLYVTDLYIIPEASLDSDYFMVVFSREDRRFCSRVCNIAYFYYWFFFWLESLNCLNEVSIKSFSEK